MYLIWEYRASEFGNARYFLMNLTRFIEVKLINQWQIYGKKIYCDEKDFFNGYHKQQNFSFKCFISELI